MWAILRPAALCMYQFAERSLIIPFSALIGILAVDELCPQGVAADQSKDIFEAVACHLGGVNGATVMCQGVANDLAQSSFFSEDEMDRKFDP